MARKHRRLAWGTLGSTYAVPMSTTLGMGGPAVEGRYLTQHPMRSTNGLVDRGSGDANPKSLYLVDKQMGIHLYSAEHVSSRHDGVNYLTFGMYSGRRFVRQPVAKSTLRASKTKRSRANFMVYLSLESRMLQRLVLGESHNL